MQMYLLAYFNYVRFTSMIHIQSCQLQTEDAVTGSEHGILSSFYQLLQKIIKNAIEYKLLNAPSAGIIVKFC